MSRVPPPPRFSYSPTMSSSVRPSGVPEIDLPFGPPPSGLTPRETEAGRIAKDLHRRIRALANNANKIRRKSPLVAAQCWHESGRLLERQAGRLTEAWICYSRALALFPDHKPSITALRRLARRADDLEVLERLVNAQCERPSHPSEKAALLSGIAAMKMRQGLFDEAIVKLKEAIETWPPSVVPRLLLICASATTADKASLVRELDWLSDKWRDPGLAKALQLVMARIEEKQGALEKALTRLSPEPGDPSKAMPLQWARFRLNLKLKKEATALSLLDAISDDMGRDTPTAAFDRLRAAISLYLSSSPAMADSGSLPVQGIDDFFTAMSAIRVGSKEEAVRASESLIKQTQSAALKEGLAISKMLDEWRSDRKPELSLSEIDSDSAACQATLSFLKMGSKEDARVPEIPAAALQRALRKQNWKQAVEVLRGLKVQTTDRDARWPLAIAEAGIRIDHLDQREEAVAELIEEDAQSNRRPLPAILRRFESRRRRLAALAIAEAQSVTDKRFKAARLAWAGHHMESTDPFESTRLYTESLHHDPSLLFSIVGLCRTTGISGGDLAKLYLTALDATQNDATRIRCMLSAGLAYLTSGRIAEAASLLAEAAECLPEEATLQRTALRLIAASGQVKELNLVKRLIDGTLTAAVDPMHIGVLAMICAPEKAALWFEKALLSDPSNRLAERGYNEALVADGRSSILSERLLSDLRCAEPLAPQAAIYQQLAHMDRFIHDDTASAALSLLSLNETLPGHRSTLVQLAVYFLVKNRKDEARRILASLAATASDEEDAVALMRFCALRDPQKTDLLQSIVDMGHATVLDLTELEGLCKENDERTGLLREIVDRLGDSQTYLSRLAQSYGAVSAHENAVTYYMQSLFSQTCMVYNAHAVARHLAATDNYRLLLDTLVTTSEYWTQATAKTRSILAAADIAREKLDDPQRAAALCLQAISIDPTNQRAYDLATETFTDSAADQPLWRKLLETRLKGVTHPVERFELHVKLRLLFNALGDADATSRAEAHLVEAAAIAAAGPPAPDETPVPVTEVSEVDEAFDEEIHRITTSACMAQAANEDATLHVALGEVYLDKRRREALALEYLSHAHAIAPADPRALTRLAELHEAKGDMKAAADHLDRLIQLVADPAVKAAKMIAYARILIDHLGEEKEAEKVLREASRVDPLAPEPIEALARIYTTQGDQVALHVHLNGALTAYEEKLREAPDNVETYKRVRTILEMKGETWLRAVAGDVIAYLSEAPPDFEETTWKVSPRLGDPAHDDYLCPNALTIGLREAMRAAELPLAALHRADAGHLDMETLTRLKRRDPLLSAVNKMAGKFNAKDVIVCVGTDATLRAAPGSPPVLVFPEAVQSTHAIGAKMFAAAAGLEMLRLHLGIFTMLDRTATERMLYGLTRALNPEFTTDALEEEALAKAAAEIAQAISVEVIKLLTPSAHGLIAAIERTDIVDQLLHVGYRAGFLAAGSVSDAIAGLRALTGVPSSPLSRLPGAGAMMAFAFSRDHIALGQRFGAK